MLIRDGHRCVKCQKAGRLEVDHIRPLSRKGDPWDLRNLQTLCRGCHIAKTKGEQPRQPAPGRVRWQEKVKELL